MFTVESPGRVLNIAHRGASSMAPENTIAAARKGLELGADMWELDVRITADGELIVMHDAALQRTSNVRYVFPDREPWHVHEFALDDIRLLDFGSWFIEQDPFGQIAAGMVKEYELDRYVGEPAPTLEEALAFTREHGWRVNLEIKDLTGQPGSTQIVKKVMMLVEELDVMDLVLISSSNQDYLSQLRETHPHIATGILVIEPLSHPDELVRQLAVQAYHPCKTAILYSDISLLIRLGFIVNVWIVNDRKTMLSLVEAGVSGIFTDFPQVLASVLTGSGKKA